MTLLDIFPSALWLVFAGLFGSIWGSFANVVICRWPQGRSVAWPGSHCPTCGTLIAAWDNVPVLSFLALRGRCRACGVTISWRYPLVELSVALLSVSCFRNTLLASEPLEWLSLVEYLVTFAFCWALVVVAFIDLDTQLIPTGLTTAITVVCLAAHLTLPGGAPRDATAGLVLGFTMVWALGQGYKLVRGELGMGMGDAHLMAMVGAMLGWQGALFTLAAGSMQGALAHLAMYLTDHRWREGPVPAWRRPVPFGPFLVMGALEYTVLGSWLEPLLREIFFF
jgi:leader peptidase (prepilin peptidase)/N-methyltransferase